MFQEELYIPQLSALDSSVVLTTWFCVGGVKTEADCLKNDCILSCSYSLVTFMWVVLKQMSGGTCLKND